MRFLPLELSPLLATSEKQTRLEKTVIDKRVKCRKDLNVTEKDDMTRHALFNRLVLRDEAPIFGHVSDRTVLDQW